MGNQPYNQQFDTEEGCNYLPLANGWGFGRAFFAAVWSLRHMILENDAMVENVAGTTFERIAPTKDLLLSSDSLCNNQEITSSQKRTNNLRQKSISENM